MKDLKLLTNYGDSPGSTIPWPMNSSTPRIACHFAFPVARSTKRDVSGSLDVVEDADERFLKRTGLNPEGALYKAYDALGKPVRLQKEDALTKASMTSPL